MDWFKSLTYSTDNFWLMYLLKFCSSMLKYFTAYESVGQKLISKGFYHLKCPQMTRRWSGVGWVTRPIRLINSWAQDLSWVGPSKLSWWARIWERIKLNPLLNVSFIPSSLQITLASHSRWKTVFQRLTQNKTPYNCAKLRFKGI